MPRPLQCREATTWPVAEGGPHCIAAPTPHGGPLSLKLRLAHGRTAARLSALARAPPRTATDAVAGCTRIRPVSAYLHRPWSSEGMMYIVAHKLVAPLREARAD